MYPGFVGDCSAPAACLHLCSAVAVPYPLLLLLSYFQISERKSLFISFKFCHKLGPEIQTCVFKTNLNLF